MSPSRQPLQTGTDTTHDRVFGVLSLTVPDMTCGHCAATIKKAIETALPGASVDADPASGRVSVRGNGDYATISAIVSGAGYTPGATLS